MRDAVSLQRAKLLHPAVSQQVIDIITKVEQSFPLAMAVRIVQGFRSFEEQAALYAKGRTTPGPRVTNAKPGSSFHNFGLAVDFAIIRDKDGNGTFEELSWDTKADWDKDGVIDWQEVVLAFKAAGWSWGGKWRTFKDYPHVEKAFGHPISWFRARYKQGQWVAV